MVWTFVHVALVTFPFLALAFALFHGGRDNPLWNINDWEPLECDVCHQMYQRDEEPPDSCQTYQGHWFCSDDCATAGGW